MPRRIRWSEPSRRYDLGKRADAISVYEQVLQEGNDEDVRTLIDVDRLIDLWGELVLPVRVRRAWADWIRQHRGLDLAC